MTQEWLRIERAAALLMLARRLGGACCAKNVGLAKAVAQIASNPTGVAPAAPAVTEPFAPRCVKSLFFGTEIELIHSGRAARVWPAIHGMLGSYPLALFTGALVSDIAYANSANMQWANFSVWMIAGGAAMGVVAAIAGIVDAVVTRTRRRRRSWHSILTIVMLITAIINGFVHSRDAWTSMMPTGLILSAITAVLVIVTSWSGFAATPELREGE